MDMDTTISILCDLIPLAVFGVFLVAAGADAVIWLRERLPQERRVRQVAGSRI
jgi:uncharacterized membrane protein